MIFRDPELFKTTLGQPKQFESLIAFSAAKKITKDEDLSNEEDEDEDMDKYEPNEDDEDWDDFVDDEDETDGYYEDEENFEDDE